MAFRAKRSYLLFVDFLQFLFKSDVHLKLLCNRIKKTDYSIDIQENKILKHARQIAENGLC